MPTTLLAPALIVLLPVLALGQVASDTSPQPNSSKRRASVVVSAKLDPSTANRHSSPAVPEPGAEAAPKTGQAGGQASSPAGLLTRGEAVNLALTQASIYEEAHFNELIANEDVKQAKRAFLPLVSIPGAVVYNPPNNGEVLGEKVPSFINSNALVEYVAGVNIGGDIDTSGRLRAILHRSQALLEAAHAGTEAAKRALVEATDEAYFGLSAAAARRRSAEQNLAAAEKFEQITSLLLNGGEVAPVDLDRARLQTAQRRDELDQAKVVEEAAADALRSLIGYDFAKPIATTDLMAELPKQGEIEAYTFAMTSNRPELLQLDAEKRASDQDARIARSERLPQLSFNFNGGLDTGSLAADQLNQHSGILAGVTLTIPIFDWGISKSREYQANLRSQTIQSVRIRTQRLFGQEFYVARALALAARSRVTLTQNAVAVAERNVDTSIARYRAGEASILEVTDAETSLAAERSALSQAVFDYQVGLAKLKQATGK